MFSSGVAWFWDTLAGISMASGTSAWRILVVRPYVPDAATAHATGLTNVTASLMTLRGMVQVAWARAGGAPMAPRHPLPVEARRLTSGSLLDVNVTVPVGSTAAVHVPLIDGLQPCTATIRDLMAPNHPVVWTSCRFVANASPGVVNGSTVAGWTSQPVLRSAHSGQAEAGTAVKPDLASVAIALSVVSGEYAFGLFA